MISSKADPVRHGLEGAQGSKPPSRELPHTRLKSMATALSRFWFWVFSRLALVFL